MSNNANDKKRLLLTQLRSCASDLPEPDAEEYQFAAPERRWESDYVWFATPITFGCRGLLVEVDGGNLMVRQDAKGRHVVVGRHTQDSDMGKLNRAAALGWLVMRVTPRMLTDDPQAVMRDLRCCLERIGRVAA